MDMHLTESSSNIAAIGWTASGPTLRVQFKNKEGQQPRVYDYEDVPESVFIEFLNAPSKGAHFARFVKGRFPTRRVQ